MVVSAFHHVLLVGALEENGNEPYLYQVCPFDFDLLFHLVHAKLGYHTSYSLVDQSNDRHYGLLGVNYHEDVLMKAWFRHVFDALFLDHDHVVQVMAP